MGNSCVGRPSSSGLCHSNLKNPEPPLDGCSTTSGKARLASPCSGASHRNQPDSKSITLQSPFKEQTGCCEPEDPAIGPITETACVESEEQTFALDKSTRHQLRQFYNRNVRAQKRHATMIEEQHLKQASSDSFKDTSFVNDPAVSLYDVFSPDEQSTRWAEFQALLDRKKRDYDSYKRINKNFRGAGKAMTIAGVRPNPSGSGHLSLLH